MYDYSKFMSYWKDYSFVKQNQLKFLFYRYNEILLLK